jgi:hypothetical protein
MHTAYVFLVEDEGLRLRLLQPIDWLALLLGALCHDLGHDGLTNAYHVNSGSELARRWNDASVLENHHCAAGAAAVERAGILAALDAATQRVFRKLFVMTRLAVAPGFARDSLDDRLLLVAFVLHCADLCTVLLPPAMSRRVAESLSAEFARQTELERQEGLPVTVMVAHDEAGKAKMGANHLMDCSSSLHACLTHAPSIRVAQSSASSTTCASRCTSSWPRCAPCWARTAWPAWTATARCGPPRWRAPTRRAAARWTASARHKHKTQG